jgi:hypothetical protein
MAWTAPMTAASNSTFTAAQFNAHVRDNLLETEPAKASGVANYFVTTGANAIATRTPGSHYISTQQSTSSTSYTDLSTVGPVVTVTTGTSALVLFSAGMNITATDSSMWVSVAVSGATTVAASDNIAILTDGVQGNFNFSGNPKDQHNRRGSAKLFTGLNAGSNTFTMVYKVGANTGHFHHRELIVYPL